jgi:hypothetical protein
MFREKGLAASGSDLAVQIDGEIVAWLQRGKYLERTLSPGRHLLTALLVPKGQPSYSWYAEYWPISQVAGPPASEKPTLSPFDRALLGMRPDAIPPQLHAQYSAIASIGIARTIIKMTTHNGVLGNGDHSWIWAEAKTREELERTLDQLFASVKKERSDFFARVPPTRFKVARRSMHYVVDAEPGQTYLLYPNYGRDPWTKLTTPAAVDEFGDYLPTHDDKYDTDWRVGEKLLKDRQ